MKICNKCNEPKPKEAFYANKRMKDGLNTFCIECHKADNLARKALNRANPEFKSGELAYKKAYRERTVDKRAEAIARWRSANQQHVQEYSKKYRNQNKAKLNFLCQKRKIDLFNRTPSWMTDDDFWMLEQAYELAALRTKLFGITFHVDHIIPLRGKNVSGLHVPTNIRVVTWLENQRKTNKFEV